MSSEIINQDFEPRLRHLLGTCLGSRAVDLDMQLTKDSITHDMEIHPDDAKELGVLLKTTRTDIFKMSPYNLQDVEQTFSEYAPPFIRMLTDRAANDIAEKSDGSIDVSEVNLSSILARQYTNRRYALSNRAFLNVLQWYTTHDRKEQLRNETEVEYQYKEEYEERYAALIDEGVLPKKTFANTLVLSKMLLSQDDYPDTSNGYFHPKVGAVIHSRIVNTPREKKVVFHELTHGMGAFSVDDAGDISHNGSFDSLGRNTESARIFTEGTTELITAALLSDEYRFQAYAHERNLIIALCETSEGAIKGRDFVEAYFDNDKALQLAEQIKEIFGPDIIERINTSNKSSSHNEVLSVIQRTTIDLYKKWVVKPNISQEVRVVAADRIIDAADGIVRNPQFLRDSTQQK